MRGKEHSGSDQDFRVGVSSTINIGEHPPPEGAPPPWSWTTVSVSVRASYFLDLINLTATLVILGIG